MKNFKGKCDFGRVKDADEALVKVVVTWALNDGRFSMQGEVWEPIRGRWEMTSGGQCLDTIKTLLPNDKLFAEMHEIWSRWHLNDMRAGCEHQRAEKWDERPIYADKPTRAYVSHADGTSSWNMLTWLPVEKGGLLSAPCPTCGYKYGTKWLKEELPQDVLDKINAWGNDMRVTIRDLEGVSA